MWAGPKFTSTFAAKSLNADFSNIKNHYNVAFKTLIHGLVFINFYQIFTAYQWHRDSQKCVRKSLVFFISGVISGFIDRSVNTPRENSSFAFRNNKLKLFKNIISFGYNFWNYIYLASYSPKTQWNLCVNLKRAIKTFLKYVKGVIKP